MSGVRVTEHNVVTAHRAVVCCAVAAAVKAPSLDDRGYIVMRRLPQLDRRSNGSQGDLPAIDDLSIAVPLR